MQRGLGHCTFALSLRRLTTLLQRPLCKRT
jgi:hypothetical protein